MAILINGSTRVICQGITGAFGAQHTRGCLHYGTRLVGGVTPGKGGSKDANGLPIFDTVRQAVRATGASATMIFVPPAFAGDAIVEAAEAGLTLICAITEGIPVQDMVRVRAVLDQRNASGDKVVLVGPNCPGVITPGPKTGGGTGPADVYTSDGCKIGIMPGYIHTHVSESRLKKSIDVMALFEADDETDGIMMIGEIGGSDEIEAARYIKEKINKPVAAFIGGRTAPPGRRMGHAGAIIGGADDTADAKITALKAAGVEVAISPAEMGAAMIRAMGL